MKFNRARCQPFTVTLCIPQDFEVMKSLVADKSPTTKFVAGPDVASTGEFLVRYVVC